jgi:hypothetical protein
MISVSYNSGVSTLDLAPLEGAALRVVIPRVETLG